MTGIGLLIYDVFVPLGIKIRTKINNWDKTLHIDNHERPDMAIGDVLPKQHLAHVAYLFYFWRRWLLGGLPSVVPKHRARSRVFWLT